VMMRAVLAAFALSLMICLAPQRAAAQMQTVEQLYQAGQSVDRAKKYQEMNLWDEAEREYWNAVAEDFNNIQARLGLGEVYRRKEMFDKAIENYQIVLKQQPDNVDVQYLISLSYYDAHQYAKAREAAEKALQMNPDLAKAENLVRLSEVKNQEQQQVMTELRRKEEAALVRYREVQDVKEAAPIGNFIPGWRLIQTAETRPMLTGYVILGATAGMLVAGHMLRSAGSKSYIKAGQSLTREQYQSLVDTGQTRYKIGGYLVDAALGITVLNLVDSFLLDHRIFGGRTRVKPSLPDRERHQTY